MVWVTWLVGVHHDLGRCPSVSGFTMWSHFGNPIIVFHASTDTLFQCAPRTSEPNHSILSSFCCHNSVKNARVHSATRAWVTGHFNSGHRPLWICFVSLFLTHVVSSFLYASKFKHPNPQTRQTKIINRQHFYFISFRFVSFFFYPQQNKYKENPPDLFCFVPSSYYLKKN